MTAPTALPQDAVLLIVDVQKGMDVYAKAARIFREAMGMIRHPRVEPVEVPYGNTSLPALLAPTTLPAVFRGEGGHGLVYFETAAVTARASGRVNFDRTINLTVRAAPLGKVTALLGPAGKLLDDATGGLLTFDARGTLAHPLVIPRPLGIPVP